MDRVVWHFTKNGLYNVKRHGYSLRSKASFGGLRVALFQQKRHWQGDMSSFQTSTLGLKARNHQSSSLSGWILDMMEVLRAQQLDIFFMAAWTIWVERNNAVWNGSDFVPVHAASWSMNLHEYQMQSSDQFSVTQSID
ncbi:uncharacterized protein LOC121050574 [Rosa chinensis]|uniref:uncharacterized protein LOC121050574 n=1 Tax=Rosa chinensis TaxID=74649 RepID=UPI001AD9478A|nr:uncharacterized protein LOC121050574 [Rosa chinensis]